MSLCFPTKPNNCTTENACMKTALGKPNSPRRICGTTAEEKREREREIMQRISGATSITEISRSGWEQRRVENISISHLSGATMVPIDPYKN